MRELSRDFAEPDTYMERENLDGENGWYYAERAVCPYCGEEFLRNWRRPKMVTKIPIDGMSREEWLAERRKSLGGSDMGAVLGLNKYRSPYAVWAEKTGLIGEAPDNEAMRQGRDLEEYVACRFEEASDKVVRRVNYILRNDDAPHLHANIDRRILKESAGLECKTASALSMKTMWAANSLKATTRNA